MVMMIMITYHENDYIVHNDYYDAFNDVDDEKELFVADKMLEKKIF